MKLTNILLVLIFISSLLTTIISFDMWEMDKEFFEDVNESDSQEETVIGDMYANSDCSDRNTCVTI